MADAATAAVKTVTTTTAAACPADDPADRLGGESDRSEAKITDGGPSQSRSATKATSKV